MKSSSSSESRRLLDFVPSFRPSFLSVVLVLSADVSGWRMKQQMNDWSRWNLALTFSPAFRVSRLKILTGCLFYRQKAQQEIFIRKFRHIFQKGLVILQVKSSFQMFFRSRWIFRTEIFLFWFRHIIFHTVQVYGIFGYFMTELNFYFN